MIQYPCFDFSTFSREEREDYACAMDLLADGTSLDEGSEEYASQAWLARVGEGFFPLCLPLVPSLTSKTDLPRLLGMT